MEVPGDASGDDVEGQGDDDDAEGGEDGVAQFAVDQVASQQNLQRRRPVKIKICIRRTEVAIHNIN